MAIITTDSKNYTDIAAAIRSKNGLETQYKPSEMAAAISAIVAGGGTDNLDVQHIISTRKSVSGQYVVFSDWKTIIPDLDKVVAILIYYDSNAVFCLKENFENRSSISGGVYVPGAMFSLSNNTFQTWDITKYKTGLRFYDNSFGIQMTMNNSNLSAGTKEAMFIIQERS